MQAFLSPSQIWGSVRQSIAAIAEVMLPFSDLQIISNSVCFFHALRTLFFFS